MHCTSGECLKCPECAVNMKLSTVRVVKLIFNERKFVTAEAESGTREKQVLEGLAQVCGVSFTMCSSVMSLLM